MTSTRWQTIVVAISSPFEEEQPALSKAAAIARRCGARLLLFNCFMLPQPLREGSATSRTQILAAETQERRDRLRTLARQFRVRNASCIVQRCIWAQHLSNSAAAAFL